MFDNLKYSYYPPSRLTIGCEPLGGTDWGEYDISEVRKTIAMAIDYGITSFDTADVYGLGKSEEELSKALGGNRHKAFIISKFGIRWEKRNQSSRSKTYKDSSPKYIKCALENSLKRLRIEAIPLYIVHWPDSKISNDLVMDCLEHLRISGKILNYGVSNFDINSTKSLSRSWQLSSIQDSFNILDYKKQLPIFKNARALALSTFSYGTLAQGLLSNKFTSGVKFSKNDRRSRLHNFKKENWLENKKILERLDLISKKYSKTSSSTAIRWALDSGYIDSAIVGVKNVNQLKDNINSLNWKLKKEDFKFLSTGYE